ncbi:hypothetical protein VaNZ11_006186 [Volvox africanus]|uniref:Ion transport domain-containing protein n=1 Tax=Volvox africanus TaxID=51714 RepID=A0ABQ5S096_9CHLO|nr:hypothetical protein VaNZ11_006186 [Volvox africanus]
MAHESPPRHARKGVVKMPQDATCYCPPPGAGRGWWPQRSATRWEARGGDTYPDPAARAGRASELFEALRAENPDVDDEDLLSGPGYQERQWRFLQERSQQEVMERLERRADTGAPTSLRAGGYRVSPGVSDMDGLVTTNGRASFEHHRSLDRHSFESIRRSHENQRGGRELQRRSQEHQKGSGELQRRSQEHVRGSRELQRRSQEHQERNSSELNRNSQERQRRSSELQRRSLDRRQRSNECVRDSRDGPNFYGTRGPSAVSGIEPSGNSWTVTHRRHRGTALEELLPPQPAPQPPSYSIHQRDDTVGSQPPLHDGSGTPAAQASAADDQSVLRARHKGADGPCSRSDTLWTAAAGQTGSSTGFGLSAAPARNDANSADNSTGVEVTQGSASQREPPFAHKSNYQPAPQSAITEDDLLAAANAFAAVQLASSPQNGPQAQSQPAATRNEDEEIRASEDGSRRWRQEPPRAASPVDDATLVATARHSPSSSTPWPRWDNNDIGPGIRIGGQDGPDSGFAGANRRGAVKGRGRGIGQPEILGGGPGPPIVARMMPEDALVSVGSGTGAGGFAAALAALGLVEVQPLSDHIQRDDDRLPRPPGPLPPGSRQTSRPQEEASIGIGGIGPRAMSDRTMTIETVATYEEFGDLSQYSLMRRWCIRLCANPDFEMAVTAIIFANCVTLCLFDPRQPDHYGLNRKLFWAELAFNICFSMEMVLRIVSMGSPWAYIRRPWNQFDCFMVVAGYTVFVPGNSSAVNAIRALRALRPLRTITRFESLRGVIVCFLEAIPLLASVGGLLFFFIFIYAVAAVQLFPKTYHWVCLDPYDVPLNIGDDPDMFGCGGSGRCPANYTCKLLHKQYTVNVAGFDNTGMAMLSVWQALTLTGWVFMMYRTVDAYSLVAVIYYVTLIFIGAYFVLNLFLAVLKIKFAKAQTLFHNQLALQRSKARRNSIVTLMNKVHSKWTEFSSKRSQASLLNSRLSSAISSRMSSVNSGPPSLRMSAAQFGDGDNSFQELDCDGRRLTAAAASPQLPRTYNHIQSSTSNLASERSPQLLGQRDANGPPDRIEIPAAADSLRNDDTGKSWGSATHDGVPLPPLALAPSPPKTASMTSDSDSVSLPTRALSIRARQSVLAAADGGDLDSSCPGSDAVVRMGIMDDRSGGGGSSQPSPMPSRTPARPALISTKQSFLKGPRPMRAVSFRHRDSDFVLSPRGASGVAEACEVGASIAVTAASTMNAPASSISVGNLHGAPETLLPSSFSSCDVLPSLLPRVRPPSPAPKGPRRWQMRSLRRVAPTSDSLVDGGARGASSAARAGSGWAVLEGVVSPCGVYASHSGWSLSRPAAATSAAVTADDYQPAARHRAESKQQSWRPQLNAQIQEKQQQQQWTHERLPAARRTTTTEITPLAPTGTTTAISPVWRTESKPGIYEPSMQSLAIGAAGPVAEAVRFAGGEEDGYSVDGLAAATGGSRAGTGSGLVTVADFASAVNTTEVANATAANATAVPAVAPTSMAPAPGMASSLGNSHAQAKSFHISSGRKEICSPPSSVGRPGGEPSPIPLRRLERKLTHGEDGRAPPVRRGTSSVLGGSSRSNGYGLIQGQTSTAAGAQDNNDIGGNERTYSAAPSSMGATNMAMNVMSTEEFDDFVSDHPYMQRQMLRLQYRTRIFVNHFVFNQVFMLLIFINTVLLAMEYNNQPASLTRFQNVANWVLTGLFTAEMIIKVFGLGFWDYVRDSFNIFDALVVTISLVEIVLSTVAGLNAARALRVLKALRVLRLFKLFRYMQSLRRIGEILLSAFTSFAAIATLLMLFWLVFSIIGMHVFGIKSLDGYEWPNFTTFLFSLISTWNVLNLENWVNTMHATIRVTNWGSSIFFVLWIVIGRYIFLTLFLAVTLEAFEAKYDANAVRMGARGGGFTSLLGSIWSGASSLRSGLSSKASSVMSSVRSSRSGQNSGSSGRSAKGGGGGPNEEANGDASGRFSAGSAAGRAGRGGQHYGPGSALPAGIGYLQDAQAAAAAEYGESNEQRVNMQKMYSIKQWIDTGSMEVLKAPEATPDASTVRRGGDVPLGRCNGISACPPGAESPMAPCGGGNWPSPMPPRGTGNSCAMPLGAGRGGRGVPYIDDSAAQSLASLEEVPVRAGRGGGSGSGGGGGDGGDGGRGVSEGFDLDSTCHTDLTLLQQQQSQQLQQPPTCRSNQTSNVAAEVGRPSTAGPSIGPTGRRGSVGPHLHSLTHAVRRDLEGVPHSADGTDSEVGDLITSVDGGGGNSWARPAGPSIGSSITGSGADSGELILSRSHGRSRLMRSTTSLDTSAVARVTLVPNYCFKQEPSGDDCELPSTAPELAGPGLESSPPSPAPEFETPAKISAASHGATLAVAGTATGRGVVVLDPPARAQTDATAAAASVFVSPASSRSRVRTRNDRDASGALPADATVSVGRARDTVEDSPCDGYQDMLDCFADSAEKEPAAGPDGGDVGEVHAAGPEASCPNKIELASLGQEVIMATFQDMLRPSHDSGVAAVAAAAVPKQQQSQAQSLGQLGGPEEGLAAVPGGSVPSPSLSGLQRNVSMTRQPRREAVWDEDGSKEAAAAAVSGDRPAGHRHPRSEQLQEERQLFATESCTLLALADELDNALASIEVRSGGAAAAGSGPGGDAAALQRLGSPTAGIASIDRSGCSPTCSELDSERTSPRGMPPPPSRLELLVAGSAQGAADGIGNAATSAVISTGGGGDDSSRTGSGSGFGSSIGPGTAGYVACQSLQDSAHSLSDVGIAGSRQRAALSSIGPATAALGSGAAAVPWRQLPDHSGVPLHPPPLSLPVLGDSAEQGCFSDATAASTGAERMRVLDTTAARDSLNVGGGHGDGELIDSTETSYQRSRGGGGGGGGGGGKLHSPNGAPILVEASSQYIGSEPNGRFGLDPWLPPPMKPSAGPAAGQGDEDRGRRGDKGPAMRRISEAGSIGASDMISRCDSFNSRASGASHTSGGDDSSGDDPRVRKQRFRKRRRASILIEGTGKAFWIWDEDHPAREWMYWVVTHKRFDYTMFALILLNCVSMALENPFIRPGSPMEKALFWSNVGFTIIFTIEAAIKMFAFTFSAYIKRITNQVDFLIVVTSLLEIILDTVTDSVDAVSALRALRALKPLRLLTRSAGMRLVFKSVTMSLMSMANVSIVCILFFLIFAILGVQLFSGRFYRCNDDSVAGISECVGTFNDPRTNNTIERTWKNDFPNFDNTGNALLCCFITATLNGYTEIMINAMSAPNEPGHQPRQFLNPGAFFWFFGFIVVCAFTLLNLYVGVIFSQFSKIRMLSETGSAFLTSDQNEWAELTKMVFRLKPPDKAQLPTGRVRRFMYALVHAKSFDIFILTIIIINVGFLAATWYNEPASYTHMKNVANIVFMSFFAAEAVAKIFALGWVGYFKVGWNKLDFVLLGLGILDLIISMLNSNFLRILRVIRVLRLIALVRIAHVAQLVKSVKGIQSLFTTLIYSLPAFGNVGALIGLFFFMYAYIGMYLFGKVQHGESLSRHVNFHNFWQALLVLMRVATGDNWTGIMFDCMVQPPKCNRSSGGCGTYIAVPYFLTFVLLIYVILLNLFTAVIIETFEKTHEQEEWKLSPQALEDFVTLWSEYDDGSGTILPRHLEELLLRLDPPLGLGPYADNKDVLRFVYDLDIPLVNARVPFHKTAFELVKRCSQATMPEGAIKEHMDRLVNKFFRELPTQDEMLNFSVAITVMKVQRKWRTRMRAAKLMRKKRWRQDRQAAPEYPEIHSNKALLAEKFEAYRETVREAAKAWEAAQISYNRKPDKGETARRTEPRWRFSAKYAPPALVQATSEKTGLLGLGKRVNVNKIMGGLLRVGGLLGGNGGNEGGPARSPQATQSCEQMAMWASPVSPQHGPGGTGPAAAAGQEPSVASPLPRLLRAIALNNGPRLSYNGGGAGGGLLSSPTAPTSEQGSFGGARRQLYGAGGGGVGGGGLSVSGGVDTPSEGLGVRTCTQSLTMSPMVTRRAPGMLSNDGGGGFLPGGANRGIW